jgi:exonuclease VII large subunit
MNQNNMLGFVLGAAIGGAAAYYIFKHEDEILEKINDLEDHLKIDRHEWVEKAKDQIERLAKSFQSTVQRYSDGESEDAAKESELSYIIEELNKLQKEVQTLNAK